MDQRVTDPSRLDFRHEFGHELVVDIFVKNEVAKGSTPLTCCSKSTPVRSFNSIIEICRWHNDERVLASQFKGA